MKDWNVVVSIYQDGFKRALRALREFGPVEPSLYHNVLVMKVDDPTRCSKRRTADRREPGAL